MLRYFAKAYGPVAVVIVLFEVACLITGRGALQWDVWTFASFMCFYFAAWTFGDVLVDIGRRSRSRSSG